MVPQKQRDQRAAMELRKPLRNQSPVMDLLRKLTVPLNNRMEPQRPLIRLLPTKPRAHLIKPQLILLQSTPNKRTLPQSMAIKHCVNQLAMIHIYFHLPLRNLGYIFLFLRPVSDIFQHFICYIVVTYHKLKFRLDHCVPEKGLSATIFIPFCVSCRPLVKPFLRCLVCLKKCELLNLYRSILYFGTFVNVQRLHNIHCSSITYVSCLLYGTAKVGQMSW